MAALGNADFTAQIYHVGEVADPSTRQVEVLAWVKNPGVLKPGFFAEVTLASETQGERDRGPGEGRAGQRPRASWPTSWKGTRRGCGRSSSASASVTAGSRSCPASPRERTLVVEGSDRLADGIEVQTAPAGAPESSRASAGAAQAQ